MPDPNNVLLPDHRIAGMLIPRAANTAVKTALLAALGRPAARPHDPAAFETADTAACARAAAEGWLVFSIVRDPIERLVSCWRAKVAGPRLHPGFGRDPRIRHRMGFADFAAVVLATPDAEAEQHYRAQAHDLCVDGRPVPTLLLAFERLDADWGRLRIAAAERGLPLGPLPRLNASTTPPPADLDPALRARLRRRYAADLAVLAAAARP